MQVIDHSVSGQSFELVYYSELDMFITNPKPSENELPKFYESKDYISHTDASQSLLDKIYQSVKRITLKSKLTLINSATALNAKNILDVGCGTGDFLSFVKTKDWNIVGVEPTEKARNLAIKKNGSVIFSSLENLIENLKEKKFSVITLWHVLEHVPDYDSYIIQLKNILEDDGTLIVALPNFKSFDAKHYKSFWAAYDVPRHLWHFSKKSIEKISHSHKMKIAGIKPMYFDSFYVSILSEKYKTGKSNFLKAFLIGLWSNLIALSSKEYSSLIYIIKKDKNLK